MRLRRMDFKERRHLDKRVLRIFIAAFVLVCCFAIIGITVANSNVTLARSSTKIEPSHLEDPTSFPGSWAGFLDGLTDYDRIRFWEGGTRGDVDYNGDIAHWQAIPPEYSAGRIISENPNKESKDKGKEAYCPVETFEYYSSETVNNKSVIKTKNWMDTKSDKYDAWCRYSGGLSGEKTSSTGQWSNAAELKVRQTKDLRAWADYYDGAAYEGEFYDMRIYEWSSFKSAIMAYEGHGPSMAAVDFIVPMPSNTMYEFHFYPKGTLKPLKNLIYKGPKPSPSNMKAEGQDSWQKGYDLYYNLAYLRTIEDKNTKKPYLSECNDNSCRKDVCLKTPSSFYKQDDGVEYPQHYRGKIQCYSDSAAYRDEAGNIIYTGVYGHFEDGYEPKKDAEAWGTASYQNAKHFIVDYTAKEYEEYLREKEKSINPLHPDKDDPAAAETQGVFKGSLQIDQWLTTGPLISILGGGTVKKNPDGTISKQTDVNIYTEHDSTYYISDTWQKIQNSFFRSKMKDVYCSDSSDICNYHWTTRKGGSSLDPLHSGSGDRQKMWMTFTSSYENPFIISWDWNMCAHADIKEDTYTVAYVFDGDVESLPDDFPEIYKQMKEFNDEYERVYKQPLKDDPFFETDAGRGIDPKMVYKLFRVAKYSDYDPYAVNKSFTEESGIEKEEFGWYNCETMEDECLIPNDNPDHTGGDQERNGITYNNGYDFIDGDRVYYGCLDCSLATYFPNTCYSNTNEPDTIKDYPDGKDVVINEYGETQHIEPMGDKVEKEKP